MASADPPKAGRFVVFWTRATDLSTLPDTNNLADIFRALGRKEESMRHLKRAVRLFSEIGQAGTSEPEVWKLVAW